MSDKPASSEIVNQYRQHRLGQEVEGDEYVKADEKLFADIARGAWDRRSEWDEMISENLTKDWAIDRLDSVLKAIIRAGTYELAARPDVPTAVVINEYVDVAHAFFDRSETSFVNGILDKIARKVRS